MSFFVPSTSRLSPWVVVTSSSLTVNIGELLLGGASGCAFYVAKDFQSAEVTKLKFIGLGKGIGVGIPLDVSFSTKTMPSRGIIYYGDRTPRQTTLQLSDLLGQCIVQVVGASAVVGVSTTVIYFGGIFPDMKFSRAVGVVDGTGLGTPGASVAEYRGYIWKG